MDGALVGKACRDGPVVAGTDEVTGEHDFGRKEEPLPVFGGQGFSARDGVSEAVCLCEEVDLGLEAEICSVSRAASR